LELAIFVPARISASDRDRRSRRPTHEGNPRRAVHQRLIDGDRRQNAELRGPERRARGENDRSSFDVLTAAPDVLLYIARIADRDRSIRSTPGPCLPGGSPYRHLRQRRAVKIRIAWPAAIALVGN